MAGYIRRFTSFPTIPVLTEIESVNIVDNTPPFPTTGIGTGTLLIVGEFEDGPFATGDDAAEWDADAKGLGVQEVFSAEDYRQRFGGFGFTYAGVVSNNPCARRHLSEFWNGNGYLKGKYVRPRRLLLARVDTTVGEVAFSSIASIEGGTGPYNLEPGYQLALTTDVGGPASSTAITAAIATAAGAAGTFPTGFAGGEQIGITIDSSPEVTVTFSAADQSNAQVISRINAALGFTSAVLNAGEVDISGIVRGTAGAVVLRDITTGTLAVIGHSAGTDAGTGTVANVDAVTAAEVVTIVNTTVALTAIDVVASVSAAGTLRLSSATSSVGTISVAASSMASALELDPIGSTIAAGVHAAGTIPAGTRVRTAGGLEWVTAQTLSIVEGTATSLVGGPYVVSVRPALDDGTAVGTSSATVTTVVDQPSFGALVVTNPVALAAAYAEPAMDAIYSAAIDATLGPSTPSREVTFVISARQSDSVRAKLRSNAVTASETGHYGRKAIISAPIGYAQSQAINQVALNRSERVFYTWPGLQATYDEISIRGTAGGLGFTENGVLTVRGDGPLASLCCQLPPEDNPGQATRLIEDFYAVEQTTSALQESNYVALKAAGICAPRIDRVSGTIFQSGITTSSIEALRTQARIKFSDFIGDSLAALSVPYLKKLSTQSRRDAIRSAVDQFLNGLQSPNNPELSRLEAYSVDEKSGNTPDMAALGIFVLVIKVRIYASLDYIVLNMSVGEAVTIEALAA